MELYNIIRSKVSPSKFASHADNIISIIYRLIIRNIRVHAKSNPKGTQTLARSPRQPITHMPHDKNSEWEIYHQSNLTVALHTEGLNIPHFAFTRNLLSYSNNMYLY